MNLYRKLKTENVFVDEATSGIFVYILADTNPDVSLYENATSIEEINLYGIHVCKDALGVHFLMKDYFYANKTWATCTNDERDIIIDNCLF